MQRPAEELEAEILRLTKQTEEIKQTAQEQYALLPTARDPHWDEAAAVRQCQYNTIEVQKLRWALGTTGRSGMRDVLDTGPIVLNKQDVVKLLTSLRLTGDISRFGPVLNELMRRKLVYTEMAVGQFDKIKWMPVDNEQTGWKNQSTADLHVLFLQCVLAQQKLL